MRIFPFVLASITTMTIIGAASIGSHRVGVCQELHQVDLDVADAATWEISRGDLGRVFVSVIDACTNATEKARRYRRWCDPSSVDIYTMLCPAALRAVMSHYSLVGGAYGCSQVRRALDVYPARGDAASVRAEAQCPSKR